MSFERVLWFLHAPAFRYRVGQSPFGLFPPPRTVHDSFPSYVSSPSRAPRVIEVPMLLDKVGSFRDTYPHLKPFHLRLDCLPGESIRKYPALPSAGRRINCPWNSSHVLSFLVTLSPPCRGVGGLNGSSHSLAARHPANVSLLTVLFPSSEKTLTLFTGRLTLRVLLRALRALSASSSAVRAFESHPLRQDRSTHVPVSSRWWTCRGDLWGHS